MSMGTNIKPYFRCCCRHRRGAHSAAAAIRRTSIDIIKRININIKHFYYLQGNIYNITITLKRLGDIYFQFIIIESIISQ